METRAVIKFFFLHGKAQKEIHAILTEILACFLPGRAKDFSAPLYIQMSARSPASQSLLKRRLGVEAKELYCEFTDTLLEFSVLIASRESPENVQDQAHIANEFGLRVIGLHL
jgi:hypothetical protein